MGVSRNMWSQAHSQGCGARGVRSTPPFLAYNRFYTLFTCSYTCHLWTTSLTVDENYCCPNKFGCSYVPHLFMANQRMNAETCVNSYVQNESLSQALETSQVVSLGSHCQQWSSNWTTSWSNLRVSFLGSMPPDPPSLACLCLHSVLKTAVPISQLPQHSW